MDADFSTELYPCLSGFEWVADFTGNMVDRFYRRIGTEDDLTGCIAWNGGHDGDGYAWFRVKGHLVKAGHVAMIEIGRWPDHDESARWEMHHGCENKGCVNPYHLIWCTSKEHKEFHRILVDARKTGIDPDLLNYEQQMFHVKHHG